MKNIFLFNYFDELRYGKYSKIKKKNLTAFAKKNNKLL